MNSKNPKIITTNFEIEKLREAGIEVVQDKEESSVFEAIAIDNKGNVLTSKEDFQNLNEIKKGLIYGIQMSISTQIPHLINPSSKKYTLTPSQSQAVIANLNNLLTTINYSISSMWVENSELWNKGKEAFKGTVLWNEVINDPNYADIKDDENLILSECHARICGAVAEKVLEHIAETDGEIAKDKVIDWDNFFRKCHVALIPYDAGHPFWLTF